MDGMSIGGIAGIGIGGTGISITPVAISSVQGATIGGNVPASATPDYIVAISDSAMKALARDPVAVIVAGTAARLADDLAALALLAMLEERNRQNGSPVATLIGAYLAVQALSG